MVKMTSQQREQVRRALNCEGFAAEYDAGNIVGIYGQAAPRAYQDRLIEMAGTLAVRSQVEALVTALGEDARPELLREVVESCRDMLRDEKPARGSAVQRILREINAGLWGATTV